MAATPFYEFYIKNYFSDRESVKSYSGEQIRKIFTTSNTDLLNRPVIDAAQLVLAGWSDAGDGIATVYSVTYTAGLEDADYEWTHNIIIDVTPIRENGTVLSPQALENYVGDLFANSTTVAQLRNLDKAANGGSNLILNIETNITDFEKGLKIAEEKTELLHELHADYYGDSLMYKGETLFQTIPLSDQNGSIQNPKVKTEIGKAGSFEFQMDHNFPYYSKMAQMKTIYRVVFCGKTIFRGRVLTIGDEDFYGHRSVHCEGDFTFLMDSQLEGIKDPEEAANKITLFNYLKLIINGHNEQMGLDEDKKFILGEVPGHYTDATESAQRIAEKADTYQSANWGSAMNRLEDLVNRCGGYFRTRYENGKTYLDWLDQYYNKDINAQGIKQADNLISTRSDTEVNNIFTVVIPVGKAQNGDKTVFINDYWPVAMAGHPKVNYIEVPELLDLYSESELTFGCHKASDYEESLEKYGRIYRTVNFDYAYTPIDLFNYAKDWIKNNYIGEVKKYNVTALDLHFINPEIQEVNTGDRVRYTVKNHDTQQEETELLTVMSAELNPLNPENDAYCIGKPNNIINQVYGNKSKNKSGGGGTGSTDDPPSPTYDGEYHEDQGFDQGDIYWNNQYMDKKENANITWDDPFAFLFYDENGTRLSEQETLNVAKKSLPMYGGDVSTFLDLKGALALPGDAPKQLFIDRHPSLKQQQLRWKLNAIQKIEELDLPSISGAEATYLISDKTLNLVWANCVDDNGNWVNRDIPNPTRAMIDKAVQIRSIVYDKGSQNTSGNVTRTATELFDNAKKTLLTNGMSSLKIDILATFKSDSNTGLSTFLTGDQDPDTGIEQKLAEFSGTDYTTKLYSQFTDPETGEPRILTGFDGEASTVVSNANQFVVNDVTGETPVMDVNPEQDYVRFQAGRIYRQELDEHGEVSILDIYDQGNLTSLVAIGIINGDQGQGIGMKINADRVDIRGILTAQEFQGERVTCNGINATGSVLVQMPGDAHAVELGGNGSISCSYIEGNEVYISTLTVGDDDEASIECTGTITTEHLVVGEDDTATLDCAGTITANALTLEGNGVKIDCSDGTINTNQVNCQGLTSTGSILVQGSGGNSSGVEISGSGSISCSYIEGNEVYISTLTVGDDDEASIECTGTITTEHLVVGEDDTATLDCAGTITANALTLEGNGVKIDCPNGTIQTKKLSLNSTEATWKSKTVITDAGSPSIYTLSPAHWFTYDDRPHGGTDYGEIRGQIIITRTTPISPTSETIYYLGR